MHVYVNGTICPAHEASVSVLDHGFLYGIGLFETMRVYDRKLFLWDDHFARLSSGLLALQIQPYGQKRSWRTRSCKRSTPMGCGMRMCASASPPGRKE
ncbi:aminodeoxychorismate lyase [Brevibacillus agri BAB-2500]|nr:aminodeoxychorismate lyase [Brevibacillus agri BAB-2500]